MGLGYRKVGSALDLPRDKVRYYCKANGLDGYAKKHLQSRGGKQMEVVCANGVCRQCGKPLEEKSSGRKQIYCSDECRRLWV